MPLLGVLLHFCPPQIKVAGVASTMFCVLKSSSTAAHTNSPSVQPLCMTIQFLGNAHACDRVLQFRRTGGRVPDLVCLVRADWLLEVHQHLQAPAAQPRQPAVPALRVLRELVPGRESPRRLLLCHPQVAAPGVNFWAQSVFILLQCGCSLTC